MRLGKLFSLIAVLGGSIGTAHAIPAFWDSSYSPDDPIKLTAPQSHSYTHDIRLDGYRPGIDSIDGALLTLWVNDDFDLLPPRSEQVQLTFDGAAWGTYGVGILPLFFSPESLLSDGLLHVTVGAYEGDFWFNASSLHVWGDRATTVPEPSTLALFGLGLMGMAFTVRPVAPSNCHTVDRSEEPRIAGFFIFGSQHTAVPTLPLKMASVTCLCDGCC